MLEMLHSVGLHTVRDLATADKYVILKLRGHDFPGVQEEDLLDFYDICDYRELALAIVDKCSINYDVEYYDGENKMPWNVNNGTSAYSSCYNGSPKSFMCVQCSGVTLQ